MKDCIDWFIESVFFALMFLVVILMVGCGSRQTANVPHSHHDHSHDVTVVVEIETPKSNEPDVIIENCGWCYYLECYACDFHYPFYSTTQCVD